MRRSITLFASTVLLLAWAVVPGRAAAAAAGAAPSSVVTAGHTLAAGHYLRSTNGAYYLKMRADGDLTITSHGRFLWREHTGRPGAHLSVLRNGNVALIVGTRTLWATGTRTSSPSNELVMANDGSLVLRNSHGVVWSTKVRNGCHANTVARHIFVGIAKQFGRVCAGSQQILTTPLTTGATALGDGTPRGTWRIQAKQRDRYLFPAAGGAYFVHYWVPYDGDYGFHDSSWQRFPYGSSLYRTQGSHGCVHLPGAMMAWFYQWAPIGTTVTIN